ncbi:MAG: sialidase family protein [Anaerolineales bacterium]
MRGIRLTRKDVLTMPIFPRSRKPSRRIFLDIIAVIIIAMMALAPPQAKVNAQGESPWAPDQRIPGYVDDTYTPVLVADNNGMVHAFASQRSGDGNPVGVVYRTWSLETGWTSPVDILLAPREDAAVQSAFLDSFGIMHVVFFGSDLGGADIYYSRAPVGSADSSQAWSAPTVIGDSAIQPSYAVLSGDGVGNLVVIYTGNVDGSGVYSASSSDSGASWSKPTPVFLVDNPDFFPFSLRLSPGQDGTFHAAWSVVTSRGVDISVHYARFDLKTSEWTTPVTLAEKPPGQGDYFGPSFPSVVDNGNEVIVMYNNGNPSPTQRAGIGRPVQMVSVSNDNGETWNPPTVPFINLEGRSGEHIIVQDSDHVVHALFVQRTAGGKEVLGGIWQSDYKNGFWSDPYRFVPTWDAHDLHAVVSQGNVLLMVWRVDPGIGTKGIWFSYKLLDSKVEPLQPYPTRELDAVATENPLFDILPTATLTPIPADILKQPLVGTRNPGTSLGIGLLLAILVLGIVLVRFAVMRNR